MSGNRSRMSKTKGLAVAGLVIAALAPQAASAQSDTYITTAVTVQNVMIGNAAGGNDQVWFRVAGQPSGVPANCMWNGYSLFYVATDGTIDPQKAMSLLLTAQVSKTPVQIEFNALSTQNDFWGWGFTNCTARRLVLGG